MKLLLRSYFPDRSSNATEKRPEFWKYQLPAGKIPGTSYRDLYAKIEFLSCLLVFRKTKDILPNMMCGEVMVIFYDSSMQCTNRVRRGKRFMHGQRPMPFTGMSMPMEFRRNMQMKQIMDSAIKFP